MSFLILISITITLSSCSAVETFIKTIFNLPIYKVIGNPLTPNTVSQLANCLEIEKSVAIENGMVNYLDKELFQALPMKDLGEGDLDENNNKTIAEGFDFEAIKSLNVFSKEQALAKQQECLNKANLLPEGGEAQVLHAKFEAVTKEGNTVVSKEIDTQVNYSLKTSDDVEIIGPGAQVKLVFNGSGKIVQLQYANRILTKARDVEVLALARATHLAAAKYLGMPSQQLVTLQNGCTQARTGQTQAGQLQTLCLKADVVYYAPALSAPVEEIIPHYTFTGTLTIDGNEVPVRKLHLPAIADKPEVNITTTVKGNRITASAKVTGGTAPYTYHWSSSSNSLAESSSSNISYDVQVRAEVSSETLNLLVTDANRLIAWASDTVALKTVATRTVATKARPNFISQALNRIDAGAEWVGVSQGLPQAGANVKGFTKSMKNNGVAVQFNRGEEAAFEVDFIDPSLNGKDDTAIDDVDIAFYTGHASGNGISFTSKQKEQFLFYDEVRWGNKDLEWLLIAACGPLQSNALGLAWWERWGRAFDGLHLLLGYATITFDNTLEGELFSSYLLEEKLSLRQAWVKTASEVQGASEDYAIMGVWGENGLTNYNDFFWDKGPVGVDIPASKVMGYWRIIGPS